MSQVEEAFKHCESLTRNHYENFPVGSFLLPKDRRKYIWAIYAFARTADDFADEERHPNETPAEIEKRLALLDQWEYQLDQAAKGNAQDPIFIALAQTLKDLQLPAQLLKDLLTAYRMDVRQARYKTWEDVLFYCKHSANPVGRLVLYVFGYRDEKIHQYSDKICTALQLTNFWQDIAVDLEKNRIYIPQDDMRKFHVTEGDLSAKIVNRAFVMMMKYLAGRTAALFNEGLPLLSAVGKDLKLEMRVTWLGGTAVLHKTEKCGFDVHRRRPELSKLDFAGLLARAILPVPLKPIHVL